MHRSVCSPCQHSATLAGSGRRTVYITVLTVNHDPVGIRPRQRPGHIGTREHLLSTLSVQRWHLGIGYWVWGVREMILVMASQCKRKQYPDPITRSIILGKGGPQPVGLLHHRGVGCHGGRFAEL